MVGKSVVKYLGPDSNKFLSYGVASVSGTILAVCSRTVLPLFSGFYKRGAGLGPALSLPNMRVIRGVLGTKKTAVYVTLVVIMATITGIIYGSIL